MLRPQKLDEPKGGEPNWIAQCRRLFQPRALGVAIPALLCLGLGIMLSAQTLTNINPINTPPQVIEEQAVNPSTEHMTIAEASPKPEPQTLGAATPGQPSAPTPKGIPTNSPPTAATPQCDTTAKATATTTYAKALTTEEKLYQANKVNLVGSLLNLLGLQNENKRHTTALSSIEATYKAALKQANCPL